MIEKGIMKIGMILKMEGQKLLGGVGVHSIKYVITSLPYVFTYENRLLP